MAKIREPAVAGMFYPADPAELRSQVEVFLDVETESLAPLPKGLIVPHAGYPYSGPIAGRGYARLRNSARRITRVVLLGPAHRVPLVGLALSAAERWATPLGEVPVDQDAAAAVSALPQVAVAECAHAREHSLEVQLPFLQEVLDQPFVVAPLVVGEAASESVAAALETLWGGDETLLVVSSDLSHYHDYETARRLDAETSQAIQALDPEGVRPDRACGCFAVRGLLLAARRHGLRVQVVDLRNSGDTAGPRDQVVGYGAYVIY